MTTTMARANTNRIRSSAVADKPPDAMLLRRRIWEQS